MLEINTINDFYSLSEFHRVAIIKALDTKTKLIDWLDKKAREPKRWHKHKFTGKCRDCEGTGRYTHVPRDSRDIHPSQITKCIKKIWFDCSVSEHVDSDGDRVPFYVWAEDYVDPYLQMTFDQGHGIHDQYQEYGRRGAWGKHYEEEVTIDPDGGVLPIAEAYWIRGSVDAILAPYIINVPGLGDVSVRVIHEYKSIKDSEYEALKAPKPDHKWQATIYARVFDIPLVVYLYVNKDSNKLKDFPVPFDFSMWEIIEKKIDRVQYYVNNRMLPVWEETSAVHKPIECTKCPYLRLCDPPQEGIKRR